MRQRTIQSTWPGLLPGVFGAPVVDNAGGGANCSAGLLGTITGGGVKLGVKPNWPAEVVVVPFAFCTLTLPSMTWTERPDGFGAGDAVPPAFGDADGEAEAETDADGAGVGVGAAFVMTALPRANEATLTAA
jgi:hypothetical protein